MDLAIETHVLRRVFGDLVVVDGIDLAVPKGSLYGFLGPNGAGKSTTIKCLTGLLAPSSGTMLILGIDPLEDPGRRPRAARRARGPRGRRRPCASCAGGCSSTPSSILLTTSNPYDDAQPSLQGRHLRAVRAPWESLPQLSKTREDFVNALSDVPPKPAEMERILRTNQGRPEPQA